MALKLRSRRRRRYIWGWVSGDGAERVRCWVADVSTDGLKLISENAFMVPDTFDIEFNKSSPNNGRCRVIWRRSCSLGVEYVR